MMTRRAMLAKLALGAAGVASAAITIRVPEAWIPPSSRFSPQDDAFLEEISHASFQLFRECAHPKTGLVKNLTRLTDDKFNTVASIAATGFGLTALCIADERGWTKPGETREQARKTLRFL